MNPDKNTQTTNIAVMQTDIGYIKKSVEAIENQLRIMDNSYVKKDELNEVCNIYTTTDKDHELRIRRIETWGFIGIGALTVIQFALNYFK